MTTYKQGDTVLLPYKFTDSDETKPRPAVILSSSKFHIKNKMVICAPITTSVREDDTEIKIIGKENQIAGLKDGGVIRSNVLYTYDFPLIHKKIGSLTDGLLRKVLDKVLDNFSRS